MRRGATLALTPKGRLVTGLGAKRQRCAPTYRGIRVTAGERVAARTRAVRWPERGSPASGQGGGTTPRMGTKICDPICAAEHLRRSAVVVVALSPLAALTRVQIRRGLASLQSGVRRAYQTLRFVAAWRAVASSCATPSAKDKGSAFTGGSSIGPRCMADPAPGVACAARRACGTPRDTCGAAGCVYTKHASGPCSYTYFRHNDNKPEESCSRKSSRSTGG